MQHKPEQALALAVIEQAIVDAHSRAKGMSHSRAKGMSHEEVKRYHEQVKRSHEQVKSARRFLLFQDDAIARFWFSCANINIERAREHWLKHGIPTFKRISEPPLADPTKEIEELP